MGTFRRPPSYRRHLHRNSGEPGRPSRNSGECQGAYPEYDVVGSPKFAKLRLASPKWSHEGARARMLPVYPGICLKKLSSSRMNVWMDCREGTAVSSKLNITQAPCLVTSLELKGAGLCLCFFLICFLLQTPSTKLPILGLKHHLCLRSSKRSPSELQPSVRISDETYLSELGLEPKLLRLSLFLGLLRGSQEKFQENRGKIAGKVFPYHEML